MPNTPAKDVLYLDDTEDVLLLDGGGDMFLLQPAGHVHGAALPASLSPSLSASSPLISVLGG